MYSMQVGLDSGVCDASSISQSRR